MAPGTVRITLPVTKGPTDWASVGPFTLEVVSEFHRNVRDLNADFPTVTTGHSRSFPHEDSYYLGRLGEVGLGI